MQKTTKYLFLANTLLTLPFGIIALAIPAGIFAGFGVELDRQGQLIARGYAATLVGYGLVFWFFRNATLPEITRPLLLAALAFNAIEAIVQGMAAMAGTAQPMTWSSVILHSILTIGCVIALQSTKVTNG